MDRYEELGQEIASKQATFTELMQKVRAGDLKDSGLASPEAAIEELQRQEKELDSLQKTWEPLHALATKAAIYARGLADHRTVAPVVPFASGDSERKGPTLLTPGQAFTASAAFKAFRAGMHQETGAELPDAAYKTNMTTAAGFAPANNRMDTVVFSAQRTPVIEDYLPSTTVTDRNSTSYMEETTFTNNAAMRSEAAAAGEAAFAWTQRNQVIEIASVTLPATDQQLSDVPSIEALINQRLTLMLGLAVETEILTGSGTTPHLQGILTKSGISTQALGADDQPSAIYKAMTKVRVTGRARPNLVVLHPNDWQDIRLLKDANGNFIWGPPSAPDPERIWGLPVLSTDAETENTGIVLDTMYLMVNNRQGVTVAITNAHASEFTSGIQRVRLDRRLNLEIWRAAAVCTVTGL